MTTWTHRAAGRGSYFAIAFATALAGVGNRLAGIASVANRLPRILVRRRLVRSMHALSDHELADIGLRRGDLGSALSQPLSHDPTLRLAEMAFERRRVR